MKPLDLSDPDPAVSRAPRPRDDLLRLERLHALGVLDTLPDAFSEAVATAAAAIANTPMAGVSLVDRDRLWFKSTCGLDGREADRDIAFCSHAVLASEPFVVPDSWLDARFASSPFVVGAPHVRFYAGFPLVVQGQPIGVLCVMDDRPRHLSADQTAQLAAYADGIAAWLQRHPHRAVSTC